MKVEVCASYSTGVSTNVELPKDKNLDDIKDIWIRYGKGTLEFRDGTLLSFDDGNEYDFDYKEPMEVDIMVDGVSIWE